MNSLKGTRQLGVKVRKGKRRLVGGRDTYGMELTRFLDQPADIGSE